MKIGIIGAGNMGGAVARSLATGRFVNESDICVANPSQGALDALKKEFPKIRTTNDNMEAVRDADIIILAVKPWLVESVLDKLSINPDKQMLVSIAAGVSFSMLAGYVYNSSASKDAMKHFGGKLKMFRVMPNTAIEYNLSMTMVAHENASREDVEMITTLFYESGMVMEIPEAKMDAGTAVASCGIAFAMKYVQAAMQAAVELGFRPAEAQAMAAQSVLGAAEILLETGNHPAVEIDRVCTPGGMTIRGINELEHNGFNSAVIRAMKATLCSTKE